MGRDGRDDGVTLLSVTPLPAQTRVHVSDWNVAGTEGISMKLNDSTQEPKAKCFFSGNAGRQKAICGESSSDKAQTGLKQIKQIRLSVVFLQFS
jgi:hypothetical protein